MKISPVLSIIIVSFNTKKLLEDCLVSLIKNDKRLDFSEKLNTKTGDNRIPAEIIVVDNGSKDGSVKFLKEFVYRRS